MVGDTLKEDDAVEESDHDGSDSEAEEGKEGKDIIMGTDKIEDI